MFDGLNGLMGAIKFEMDKSAYVPGDKPTYRITGGQPDSIIAWTSFKDGVATGEYQADYGQRIGADGSWSAQATQPWSETDVGQWQKQAVVIAPDRTIETAQILFSVWLPSARLAQGAPDIAPDPQAGQSFFNQSVTILGQQIPVLGLVVLGGAALFAFTRR